MSTVMETRVGSETLVAGRVPEDRELRDDVARTARRPGWFAVVVVLDAIAILAFITWVVVPRLT